MSETEPAYFAIVCEDKEGALSKRMAMRDVHFAYLQQIADNVTFAGALFDENDQIRGSMLVVRAADRGEAETLLAGDPFVEEGVYGSWTIRRWSYAIGR